MRNGKHYLVALNTHVFPTRRGDDVGLAGGWVDAFLAEGEHARACLFSFLIDLAKVLSIYSSALIYC